MAIEGEQGSEGWCGLCSAPANRCWHPKWRHADAVPIVDAQTTSIRPLPRAHKQPFEPQADVIELLEKVLEEAKSGKARGCAIAVVYHNDLAADGGGVNARYAVGDAGFALGEAITRLRWKYDQSYDNM